MLTTLVMTLWAASAAQGTVVLLPVEIADFGGQTVTRRNEVEEALRGVLGPRLTKAPNGTPVCTDDKCFRMLAEAHGADEVAHVVLRRRLSNGYGDLTVRIYDADGQLVLAITETLPEDRPEETLRQVCTRAFDASTHAGRIEVVGLADDEELLVDGLPMSDGLAQLSVGPHVVTARTQDGRERQVKVMVPFRGTARARLPASASAAAAPSQPLWPALVALTAGVGGAVLAGVAIGVSIYDQNAATEARTVTENGLPLASRDPAQAQWDEGYGADHGGSTTPTARARWTAIGSNLGAANEAAASALFVTAGAGIAIAAAGGVGSWFLWPASDTE
jgi:hypothetical protein